MDGVLRLRLRTRTQVMAAARGTITREDRHPVNGAGALLRTKDTAEGTEAGDMDPDPDPGTEGRVLVPDTAVDTMAAHLPKIVAVSSAAIARRLHRSRKSFMFRSRRHRGRVGEWV